MEWMSVPDAAEMLRLSAQRVRQLIQAGDLEASRLAGRWLIDHDSVERLAQCDRPAGRPWAPARAWALLALAARRQPAWLSSSEIDRLEAALDRLSLRDHASRLRQRANRHNWYVHPGLVDRLLAEDCVVTSGARASGMLRDSSPADVYVHPGGLDELIARYAPDQEASDPNVVARIVRGPWPFAPGERQAWPVVAAIDLLERGNDSRARRVAEELLVSA